MKQRLFRGQRIDLKDLAREENVHYSTAWRWALKGISGVRLPTWRLGGKRWTTREAVEWWSEQLTLIANGERAARPRTEQREREIAAAEAKLTELGM